MIAIERVVVGDLVVYARDGNAEHVGMVTQVYSSIGQIPQLRILSKWGHLGEIEHNLHDVPEVFGIPDSYWSEKIL